MNFFHWLCQIVFILGIVASQIASGADKGTYSTGGGGSSRSGDSSWRETDFLSDIKGFADRPSIDMQQAIRIEWEKPTFDRLGNICTFRGRLLFMDQKSNELRPVNWLQGLMLYVARTPALTPDWSNGVDENDTAHATTICSSDGQFSFQFELREVQTDRLLPQDYQVGIALAEKRKTGKNSYDIIWKSEHPAIRNTVQKLTLPAAEKISHELHLVNQARGWPFMNPNSVVLIRAVNALQRSGKENALKTLEEFTELSVWHESDIVFWIIRVLFEPINLEDQVPYPFIAVAFTGGTPTERANWPLDPMVVIDDIPFMLGYRIALGGQAEHPGSHIEWARQSGVIREQPLKPSGNPMLIADSIMKSPQYLQVMGEPNSKVNYWSRTSRNGLRNQAIEMVNGKGKFENGNAFYNARLSEKWAKHLEESNRLHIRWNADEEKFSAGSE